METFLNFYLIQIEPPAYFLSLLARFSSVGNDLFTHLKANNKIAL
jgi:hypothetical protein